MKNALKIPTYKTLAARISANTSFDSLLIQATNIRNTVSKQLAPSVYLILAKKAERKAQYVARLKITRNYRPAPINNPGRENTTYNKYIFATAFMIKHERYSVCNMKTSQLSYTAMLVKQVEEQIPSPAYFALLAQGSVEMSAEYFVYKYGKKLVSASIYAQVASLFESKNVPLKLPQKQVAVAA